MKLILRRSVLITGIVSAFSVGGYLLTSHWFYEIGFPLDDAWIHQTYARNLALHGEWSYILGHPSGGSTGPLWSAILAIGYLFGIAPYIWTYLIGWLLLWMLSVVGILLSQVLNPAGVRYAIWTGLLLSLEWHLIWMAGSGMETLLFTLVATSVLATLMYHNRTKTIWWVMGGSIGLSVWLRPDGITLLGPALMVLFLAGRNRREVLRIGACLLAGFLLAFIPYLLFNQNIAGSWWPNTFFAKQAEYAELQNIPFYRRLLNQALLPMVGVGATLLPGFLLFSVDAVKEKRWKILAVILWIVGYLWMYAWRLPVTYQHGRYVMPMMPAAFIFGFAGLTRWVQNETKNKWQWILKRAWFATVVIVLLSFWIMGARAYAQDVAVIESEMVATADWLNKNLPEDALIAIHDVGAVGYFTNFTLVDLAGFISPDVIPILRDESLLKKYLDDQEVDYLVTFPGWYPVLTTQAELIFTTKGTIAPSLDYENMAVYRWNGP